MDVLTVGGVTIDAFLQIDKSKDVIRLDREKSELRIKSGEKIAVDSCIFSLGGNACNVAVGLSRLGFQTGICAEIGIDEFAQKILGGLEKDRIEKDFLIQTPHTASSFTVALNVENDRTLFVGRVIRKHDFSLTDVCARWVYLTSLGDEWEGAYQKSLSLVQNGKKHLVFNPGTPQLAQSYPVIEKLLTYTDILCVNKQEAQTLLRFYGIEKSDIKDILAQAKELGPKIISITDGLHGAYSIDENGNTWMIERFPATVVERTGAGDAYATGFMAAIIEGKDVPEAMRWGSVEGASVIASIGAQKGLLHKDMLTKTLEKEASFTAKSL